MISTQKEREICCERMRRIITARVSIIGNASSQTAVIGRNTALSPFDIRMRCQQRKNPIIVVPASPRNTFFTILCVRPRFTIRNAKSAALKYTSRETETEDPVNLASAKMPPKVIRHREAQSPSIPSIRFRAFITPTTQNTVITDSKPTNVIGWPNPAKSPKLLILTLP